MTAPTGDGRRRIVVGLDGSAPSKAALAWAISQAKLTGAVVEAVIAWESPAFVRYPNLSAAAKSATVSGRWDAAPSARVRAGGRGCRARGAAGPGPNMDESAWTPVRYQLRVPGVAGPERCCRLGGVCRRPGGGPAVGGAGRGGCPEAVAAVPAAVVVVAAGAISVHSALAEARRLAR
jgi:hypothetical protein